MSHPITSLYSGNPISNMSTGEISPPRIHRSNNPQDTISFAEEGFLPAITYSLRNLSGWVRYGLGASNVLPPSSNKTDKEKFIAQFEQVAKSSSQKIEWLVSIIQLGIDHPTTHQQNVMVAITLFADKAPNEFNQLSALLRKEAKIPEKDCDVLEWISHNKHPAFLALCQAGLKILKSMYYHQRLINGIKNLENHPSMRMGNLYALLELNYQKKLHEKSFVKEVVKEHIAAASPSRMGGKSPVVDLSLQMGIEGGDLELWIHSDQFNYKFLLENVKKNFLRSIYSQFANDKVDNLAKLDLLEFLLQFVSFEGMVNDSFSIKNTICFFAEKNEDLFSLLASQINLLHPMHGWFTYEEVIKDWLTKGCVDDLEVKKKLEVLQSAIRQTIHFLKKEEFCINARIKGREISLIKKEIQALVTYCCFAIKNKFSSAYLVEMFITFFEHNKNIYNQLTKCILQGQQGEFCRWKDLSKSLIEKIENHPLNPERRAEKEDAKRCQFGKFWYGGALSVYIASGRYDQMKEEAYGAILKEYIYSNERDWGYLVDGITIWLLQNYHL